MSDSHIEKLQSGGVAYVGEDATRLYAAVSLKHAIKTHKSGMKIRRGVSNRMLFDQATLYTGKSYKSKEFDKAIEDMDTWIEAARASIPVVQRAVGE
jgi:hypothetical protein